MKKSGIILLSYFLPLLTFGQLNRIHNSLRIDDIIIKQQVIYIPPGESGNSVIWDFSRLTTIDDEYTLSYGEPPVAEDSVYVMGYQSFPKDDFQYEELIVGTEHNTMYYYLQRGDSLLLLGHENPAVKLQYTSPIVEMIYPFNVGQSLSSVYDSRGLYSGTAPIRSQGNLQTTIDAYGKMILPTGDTLNPVIRVKTIQTLMDTSSVSISELQTYRWYTKGYRYPIFESIRNVNLSDSTEIFATSFLYPPQDHFYLDTDPENLALLDELWDIESLFDKNMFSNRNFDIKESGNLLSYNIYPNPVESILNIECEIREGISSVNILFSTMEGVIVRNIFRKNVQQGMFMEQIDCSNLMSGRSYVVRVVAGENVINEKILKK